jgi:hypothetical protein
MQRVLRGSYGCDQFFYLGLGGRERLRQEIFYLAYHLHWSWREVMGLEVGERHLFVKLLAQRIEAENQALEALEARYK